MVKDLLDSLVKRGIDASRQRLFVIGGGKRLRSAIDEVYGEQALVQRCRIHKLRNVAKRLFSRSAHAGQKRDAWGLPAL